MAGKPVAIPSWDGAGDVWLQRTRPEEAGREDQISVQIYRVLEDGIPLWLRTAIELTVSGKSREESLGFALPSGWNLATVESPLPVAIDGSGQIKVQVRAGKWMVHLDAFRTNDANEIAFADNAQPVASLELIGFQVRILNFGWPN